MEDLKNTIIQRDLIDIYKSHHPTTAKYKFFLSTQRAFTKIDYILGHIKKSR